MPHRVIRLFHLLLRFGLPLVLVILLGFAVYDRFSPWALANAMIPNRPGQTRLLIGAGYSSQSTYPSGTITERSAEFVFYPEVLKTRESYFLSRRSDRDPKVTVRSFSPVLYLIAMLFTLSLTIAAWWLPLTKKKTRAHVA